MDNTTQFILFAKRILRELSALNETVSASLLGVQKQISSIRDQQEATNQQQQQQPPVLRAELQIPESVERHKQTYQKKQYRLQKWLTVGTWLAFIAAGVYAGVAAFQLHQMKLAVHETENANQITKDALLYVQRAFVFLTQFDVTRLTAPGTNRLDGSMRFSFHWENGGSTPTRSMTGHISAKWFNKRLPKDFAFPDFPDSTPFKMFVGPKATSRSVPIVIAARDIISVHNHVGHLYLWGWARYNDVFPGTKQHITRFCAEITDVIGDLTGPSVNIQTSNCEENNCWDDECKNQ